MTYVPPEYPEEFDLRELMNCWCRRDWRKGYLIIRDKENRYFRIKEDILIHILKFQITKLNVVKKRYHHHLEL